MLIYILLLLFLFLLGFCECLKIVIPSCFKIVVFILLLIISGFRYGIGDDYWSYIMIYNSPDVYVRIEPLYMVINSLLRFLELGPQFAFLFYSFITLYLIYLVLNKTNFYFQAFGIYVVSYLYFESMNTVRQAVAMSLYFYGYFCFLDKNNKKFYLYWFIASLFHYSTIFMIIFPYLSKLKINLCSSLMLIIITLWGGSYIFSKIVGLVNIILTDSLYAGYLNNIEIRGVNSGMLQIFLNALLLCIYLISYKKMKHNEKYRCCCNMLLFSIIIYNIFINFYILLRLYFDLYLFIICVIPIMLTCFKRKTRALLFSILYILYFLPLSVNLKREAYYPYKYNFDIFKEVKYVDR